MFRAQLRPDLYLRLLEERHAPTVFALVNRDREFLTEWLPWVESTRREEDTASFIRASLEQFASNSGFAAGVWWNEQFVGVIGTHKIDWLNRKVELGYWLGRDSQGHGIMTDACRAAVTHLLVEMDLNRVVIQCATGNVKSCAIPRRLGFALEGTARDGQLLGGRYQDLLMFSMLRRDWKPCS